VARTDYTAASLFNYALDQRELVLELVVALHETNLSFNVSRLLMDQKLRDLAGELVHSNSALLAKIAQ
jgi:hypothetical protein